MDIERYNMSTERGYEGGLYVDEVKDPNGQWCRYSDVAARLELGGRAAEMYRKLILKTISKEQAVKARKRAEAKVYELEKKQIKQEVLIQSYIDGSMGCCYFLEEEFVHDYTNHKGFFGKEEDAIKAAENILKKKGDGDDFNKNSEEAIKNDYRGKPIHRWSNGGYETYYLRIYKEEVKG